MAKTQNLYTLDMEDTPDPVSTDESEFEDFMAGLDRKAKSFRSKIIADAFGELVKAAREERKMLLKSAVGDFTSLVEGIVSDAVKKMADSAASNAVDVGSSVADVSSAQKRVEKSVAQLKTMAQSQSPMDASTRAMLSSIQSSISNLSARIDSYEAREADGDALASIRKLIESQKPIPVARPAYNLKVIRDDWMKITNIVATPIE